MFIDTVFLIFWVVWSYMPAITFDWVFSNIFDLAQWYPLWIPFLRCLDDFGKVFKLSTLHFLRESISSLFFVFFFLVQANEAPSFSIHGFQGCFAHSYSCQQEGERQDVQHHRIPLKHEMQKLYVTSACIPLVRAESHGLSSLKEE